MIQRAYISVYYHVIGWIPHFFRNHVEKGCRQIAAPLIYFKDQQMLASFHGIKPWLLVGFPKSGNTWFRFVLINYRNILKQGASKTVTYDELNRIQHHQIESWSYGSFKADLPAFYSTHKPYRVTFDNFHIIYIYRNPLDVLISFFYMSRDRKTPFFVFPYSERKKLQNIDYFVFYNLPRWIKHYQNYQNKACMTITYEEMKSDPARIFKNVFEKIFGQVDANALAASIRMSSFDEIKKMEKTTGQSHGNADKHSFTGSFARNGKVGQYSHELQPETVALAKDLLKKENILLSGLSALRD